MALTVGVHLLVMIAAFVAIALAIKDIQANAALDEYARSRWTVAMACALPFTAIAYLALCSRQAAHDDTSIDPPTAN